MSYLGDQVAQVAIAVLVYVRTGSPWITALAYALTYLPPIAGVPLLSGLADHVPRRELMITVDLIRSGLLLIMALPGVSLPWMCTLLFATVLIGPSFSAARSALMSDVLPAGRREQGFVVGNATFQASQSGGFLAGGIIVATFGAHRALAMDSLTFCLSAGLISIWVRARPRQGTAPARPPFLAACREGAAIIFGHPGLRTMVLLGWLAGFAVMPEALAVPYARALGGGPVTAGLLMSAMPAGTIAGAVVIRQMAGHADRLKMMGRLAMLTCAPLIGSMFRPPLWMLLPLWTLAGAGGAYQLLVVSAFVRAVPRVGRAEAFGFVQSGLLAAQGVGILIAGAAACRIGPQGVVGIAGLLGMTAAATLAAGWTHHRRFLPRPPARDLRQPDPAMETAAPP